MSDVQQTIEVWEAIRDTWKKDLEKVPDDPQDPRWGLRIRYMDRVSIVDGILRDLKGGVKRKS
jgi:hypothetical protein